MISSKTFIYCLCDPITHIPKYVGKSNDPARRLECGHMAEKGNTKKLTWLKSLRNRNLKAEVEIIDEVNVCEWQFWEQYYISLYKSWGFDLKNGDNGGLGRTRNTKEIREKISLGVKNSRPANFKPWNYGKIKTTIEKEKMFEQNPNKKEVEQLDIITGQVLACYPSLSKAAVTIGIKNYSQISNSIKNNSLCKGYKWQFKNK